MYGSASRRFTSQASSRLIRKSVPSLVDFVEREGGCAIVRGLRAVSDFEYEFQLALMNRRLNPNVETTFLTPKEEYSFLSSRLAKEVFSLGGDLTGLVPEPVLRELKKRLPKR